MTEPSKANGGGNGAAPVGPGAVQAEEALNALRGAAMAGDLHAKTELGQRLLSDPRHGHDLLEGVAVTVSAANDGSGEGAYRTAVLAAGGISMPKNWRTALIYCRRAAEMGYRPAQVELAGLSKDRELAARALRGEEAAEDVWEQLRASVDLKALMTPPKMKSMCLNPRIATIEKFVSPEHCDALIDIARGRLQPLGVVDGKTMDVEIAGALRLAATDMTLNTILLLDRIVELLGLPNRGLEPPAIMRFAGGKDYPSHVDYLDPADPVRAEIIANEGQRAVTFLVFLNDDFSGGETDFPDIPMRFKGKKGDALFWWNTSNDGVPVPATLNGNLAVVEGEKWVFSQWVCVPVRRMPQAQPASSRPS